MKKIINFPKTPTKKVTVINDVSEFEEFLKKHGSYERSYGRSQGFLLGCIVSSALNVIISFCMGG